MLYFVLIFSNKKNSSAPSFLWHSPHLNQKALCIKYSFIVFLFFVGSFVSVGWGFGNTRYSWNSVLLIEVDAILLEHPYPHPLWHFFLKIPPTSGMSVNMCLSGVDTSVTFLLFKILFKLKNKNINIKKIKQYYTFVNDIVGNYFFLF